ncbi:oligosaccharide biosynthesis protein Alg14 like-domain-containing protein [Talaromyces proteolyticus]|uniref:UDP-N-acetylglucosamine transferase subunit ALG14 n=1 Tax=Talaromyces proteolyticus TaxID=1131652 RepID=A0AAD4KU76_9EURO|nr:oligosaccharide biosynthesis protein Alg14 like-domain-containing protein [Talaromyces proteolyticus]KAH8697165.1 oligosaccharide biosynthesis protein Alg14 like-domain-containing protein [Talaromyces proteolyticus]
MTIIPAAGNPPLLLLFATILATLIVLILILFMSLHSVLSSSQQSTVPKIRRKGDPAHLLVVLGSGGHTAEMLSMLRRMPLDPTVYTFRTYVVTSGDGFSASKAVEFESSIESQYNSKTRRNKPMSLVRGIGGNFYDVVTVPRARRVHQSFLTAPLSTIQCFWACFQVLRGRYPDQRSHLHGTTSPYPDLILTNGPATAVCVILGAKVIRFLDALCARFTSHWPSTYKSGAIYPLRTIFVESWARVTTFSLSGKILLPFVDRFLVQWPNLEGKRAWKGMKETQFVGTLVG